MCVHIVEMQVLQAAILSSVDGWWKKCAVNKEGCRMSFTSRPASCIVMVVPT